RCQVHFLRNIFSSIPKKNSKPFREAVKAIFKFTDIELARTAKDLLVISVAETGLWASMFPQLPPLLSKSSKRIITLFQKPMLNSMISKKHYLKEILSGLL
ncbi:transposase, partial [Enterococcus faecium]|uniref:transposase n=1 Tax=Enterococcus faecium TaxID=1352 RepID=UPI001E4CE775